MTQRLKVSAQTHTTNVWSGHIPDEISGDELLTRSRIGKVTFRRFRVMRSLIGTGFVETPIDVSEITIPAEEYELFEQIQAGLEHSTNGKPYTFLWRVPESREPFFEETGTYHVEFKFHPRDAADVEKLAFEVSVT